MKKLTQKFLSQSKKVQIICMVALVLVFSLVADFIYFRAEHAGHHPSFAWHKVYSFDYVYGLLGCLLIVLLSKFLGKAAIQKSEDYYQGKAKNE